MGEIMKKICSVNGCIRPVRHWGLCSRHGIQKKRGEEFTSLPLVSDGTESLEERMEWRTERTESCWNWTGTRSSEGYGRIRYRKELYAHRVAWELANGEIPTGKVIDHLCRNRACVNPDHLQLVSQKENTENIGVPKNNTSGVRGVSLVKATGKYEARVMHNYKTYSAGYHDTIEEAARAVIDLRSRLHTNNLSDRGENGSLAGRCR